ncbi:MAG: hypothetical protein Terrestrivirus3_99 [Terrestrivirus sp.]|uniref:Uncharacterized protein n=1 Tax=Terrestrivirus sp. TaxID=2487775 RepID=A0A3G4ZLU3_9VIRU|nr:MAG: hypothetical protein Terrestrivirus3_99 [Terrestrivirus sp.]
MDVIDNERDSKTMEFINKAIKLHGEKYDYMDVVYIKARILVKIKCKYHNKSFEQMPFLHLRGSGCIECGSITKANKKRKTTERFIEQANKIHGKKYDYSKVVYETARDKVLMICSEHGEFSQAPYHHLEGRGCYNCNIENRRVGLDEFITRSNKLHNNRYDYSKVVYVNSTIKVNIICKRHGEFYQLPSSHLFGIGCYECGIIKRADACKSNKNEFVEKAKKIHGNIYDYSNVEYIDHTTIITIKCEKHGIFSQKPVNHLQGRGCIKCHSCPKCLLFKTNGYICSCCKYIDKKIERIKEKELYVVKFLREKLPDHEFIHNKSVGIECTGGRLYPDIRFDFDHYNLIIEIDEHEHRGSGYECDKARMYDIIAKLGLPCIFIRYNPDNKISDLNILLKSVEEYLDLDVDDTRDMFDNYGFKVIYLFYKKIID